MDRRSFSIVSNELVANKTYKLVLELADCETIGELYFTAGQFVDIAIPGFFLRRPLAVCDFGKNWLSVYYKIVGEGTKFLASMSKGEELDVLVGLGHGFDPSTTQNSALLVGGGLGCGALYLLAKELLVLGKKVTVVQCFNTADDIVLSDDFEALGVNHRVATLDGTYGIKGLALDVIRSISLDAASKRSDSLSCESPQSLTHSDLADFDYLYTCGPIVMMKSLCTAIELPAQASLEERMGCGAGYCYGCTCQTLVGAKTICKDGPVFNKEDIIW